MFFAANPVVGGEVTLQDEFSTSETRTKKFRAKKYVSSRGKSKIQKEKFLMRGLFLLTPSEIEDCLCIYKDELQGIIS
jgi:hypothetical protein